MELGENKKGSDKMVESRKMQKSWRSGEKNFYAKNEVSVAGKSLHLPLMLCSFLKPVIIILGIIIRQVK
jgi:hypothetical protein